MITFIFLWEMMHIWYQELGNHCVVSGEGIMVHVLSMLTGIKCPAGHFYVFATISFFSVVMVFRCLLCSLKQKGDMFLWIIMEIQNLVSNNTSVSDLSFFSFLCRFSCFFYKMMYLMICMTKRVRVSVGTLVPWRMASVDLTFVEIF